MPDVRWKLRAASAHRGKAEHATVPPLCRDRDRAAYFSCDRSCDQCHLQRADLSLDRRTVRMRPGALTHASFRFTSPPAVLSLSIAVLSRHAVHTHSNRHAHPKALRFRTYNAGLKPF